MTIRYKAAGKDRKRLAQAIADHLERELEYMGAPTFAYRVDFYTIDRNSNLIFDDRADTEEIEELLDYLDAQGFEAEDSEQPQRLEITIAVEENDTETFDKAQDIITSKQTLFKHALRIERPVIERTEDGICFPWFSADSKPEEIKAYQQLAALLVKMAKNAKRVVVKERPVDNEKYAFRCFLLRLGFIGDEYKQSRKILLRNLSGSSAFKTAKEAQ